MTAASPARLTADPRTPSTVLAAYAAPVLASTFFVSPSTTVLPGLYAKHHGLALASLAAAILFARMFDAILDPLIGHWSDRLRERTGSRKPLILAGGVLMPVSAWFLYAPAGTAGIAYFTAWFLCLYLAWTLFEIPHSAWGAEIATAYEDRARLFSFRALAFYAGGLVFFLIPLLPVFPSHEINFDVLRASVIAVSALLAAMLVALWRLVPDGRPSPPRAGESLRDIIVSVVANRPLVLLIAAYLIFGVGLGMWSGLLFLYIDAYLGLGQQVALVFAVATPVAVAGLPVWYRVIRRFGMPRTWAISNVGIVAAIVGTALLEPGQAAFLPLVAASLGVYFFASCQAAVAPAMLAGAADYGTWKFGVDRTATYYAVFTFTSKIVIGLGAAAGLALAGAFGFDATARVQTPQAILGLKLAFAWVPALVALAALPLILASPIDARRQDILRRRLGRRAARSS